jgi:hypothetical protein
MGTILDGPETIGDHTNEISFKLDDEKKARLDKLLVELPMALDIVLKTQSFDLGTYKTKTNYINWKKIK